MQTLISEEQLKEKIAELKETLKKNCYDYAVCVLNGAYLFFAELTKELDVEIDFIKASSYRNTHSTGELNIIMADFAKFKDKKVLLVDDVCDTGLTLSILKEKMLQNGCKCVDICVLLNKKAAHGAQFDPNFYAFEIGNEFVIGYGLDYNGRYRTLPYIAVM